MILKKWIPAAAVIVFSGCALTYTPPQTKPIDVTQAIATDKEKTFNATMQALSLAGYTITASDKNSGVISTSYKEIQADETVADCGTTAGIDYLKDHRTVLKVAMAAVITGEKTTLKANFQADYRPGSQLQNITLICVSRGKLEMELLNKITG